MIKTHATDCDYFITWKELRRLVTYSRSTIYRMELAGTFPRRITLSRSRVVWSHKEVMAWIENAKLSRTSLTSLEMRGMAA